NLIKNKIINIKPKIVNFERKFSKVVNIKKEKVIEKINFVFSGKIEPELLEDQKYEIRVRCVYEKYIYSIGYYCSEIISVNSNFNINLEVNKKQLIQNNNVLPAILINIKTKELNPARFWKIYKPNFAFNYKIIFGASFGENMKIKFDIALPVKGLDFYNFKKQFKRLFNFLTFNEDNNEEKNNKEKNYWILKKEFFISNNQLIQKYFEKLKIKIPIDYENKCKMEQCPICLEKMCLETKNFGKSRISYTLIETNPSKLSCPQCRSNDITNENNIYQINSLPGYLQVSENNVLFYWFITSQNNSENAPLIVWFNGPGDDTSQGCSSIEGLFSEIGPYLINSDGTISGISYAGYTAPLLGRLILNGQECFKLNLKGIILGNPILNIYLNKNMAIKYSYSHGFVDENLWNEFKLNCCKGFVEPSNCDINFLTGDCKYMTAGMVDFLYSGRINPYNIYKPCGENGCFDIPERSYIENYLNQEKVQKALHISNTINKTYHSCFDLGNYLYRIEYDDISPILKSLLNENIKIMIFHGDTDALNFFSTSQKIVEDMGFKLINSKQAWSFKNKLLVLDIWFFDYITLTRKKDEINNLPGINFNINFKHFSGYLKVSNNIYFHYWFVTTQGNIDENPLIFWFNGGPGCSSLDGLLSEIGPYLINSDGKTLRKNNYSWNKYSSIVFIESPAGVGYSYSINGNITTNDDNTAINNYEAIKQFLIKFSFFNKHPIFIAGESYAGFYIPMLTSLIIDEQNNFPINLKVGIAIGNGMLSETLNIDTVIPFAYGHGGIGEDFWQNYKYKCCNGCIDGCKIKELNNDCLQKAMQKIRQFWGSGINAYDIYRNCDHSSNISTYSTTTTLTTSPSSNKTKNIKFIKVPFIKHTMQKYSVPLNNFVLLNKNNENKQSLPFLSGSVPCIDENGLDNYLNNQKVKQALNIPKNENISWTLCNIDLYNNYKIQYNDIKKFILKILNANIKTLFYYGDTDAICNFMMGQRFSEKLGLNLTTATKPCSWRWTHVCPFNCWNSFQPNIHKYLITLQNLKLLLTLLVKKEC
ncbi:Carboxypeptidase, partial [Meloidogyne graminicola]